MAKKARTRNGGTMTDAQFFSMIRSALRNLTVRWKPRQEAKNKARRKNQSANKRMRWEYQCNICKGWFSDKDVEVDHIIPAGSIRSFDDIGGFAERLFCDADKMQVVCKSCHAEKTKKDREQSKN